MTHEPPNDVTVLAKELERWFDSARTIARDWIDFKNEAMNILHLLEMPQRDIPPPDRTLSSQNELSEGLPTQQVPESASERTKHAPDKPAWAEWIAPGVWGGVPPSEITGAVDPNGLLSAEELGQKPQAAPTRSSEIQEHIKGDALNAKNGDNASSLMASEQPVDLPEEELDAIEAATWKYEELRKDSAVDHCMAEAIKVYKRMSKGKLPEGMEYCTILFKQCDKGHGRLTATNWIDHGCQQCVIDALKPVSVDLEKCTMALFNNNKHTVHEGFFTRQITWGELAEGAKGHLRNDAKAVLDAAGVKYVD